MLRHSILHKYLLNNIACRSVVTAYGTGYKNPTSLQAVNAVYAESQPKRINSQITITNGDSIASTYFVGRVPSNAIIDPRSLIVYAAITSVTSMHLGFAASTAALVSAKDISSAGNGTLLSIGTLTTANMNKRAWELAGLTTDPGGFLDIIATINVAATATGVVQFFIDYGKPS